MFLTEKELRDMFWRYYNYKNRALRYQFEIEFRKGATDLLTLEQYQGHYQLNSFEFKLTDIKKAILQAKGNQPYVNKSWIVVPAEKKSLLCERYQTTLTDNGVGAIVVEEAGRWEMVVRPSYQEKIFLCQGILDFLVKEGR